MRKDTQTTNALLSPLTSVAHCKHYNTHWSHVAAQQRTAQHPFTDPPPPLLRTREPLMLSRFRGGVHGLNRSRSNAQRFHNKPQTLAQCWLNAGKDYQQ